MLSERLTHRSTCITIWPYENLFSITWQSEHIFNTIWQTDNSFSTAQQSEDIFSTGQQSEDIFSSEQQSEDILSAMWQFELQRRIQALEMRCYRKILRISYEDHVTNGDVFAKIQQAIGPHEDLLTIVKRGKLKWYGHVSRSSGLDKTILQGTVKGGRRQGRQRKRWEDNIREWTGLEFANSQRQLRTEKNGANRLWSHLWCSSDPRGWGIGEGEDDSVRVFDERLSSLRLFCRRA